MSSRVAPLLITVLAGAGCSLFMLDDGELSGGRAAPSAEGGADVADISPSEAGTSEPDVAVEATSRYASAVLADEPTLYWRCFPDTVATDVRYARGHLSHGRSDLGVLHALWRQPFPRAALRRASPAPVRA